MTKSTKVSHGTKLKCWHIVEQATKDGSIKIPEQCENCGKKENPLQAHHADYSKPLDVKYLCKGCHMKEHHGKSKQKDNSTIARKVMLRKHLLKEIDNPVVMETHGGFGKIYERCYAGVKTGVVFEKKGDKSEALSRQRPNWLVYECDCVNAIQAGAGSDLNINFIDIDPYGEPWPVIDAIFGNKKYLNATMLGICINDGLRQKLKLQGGWQVHSMRSMVEKYGNRYLYGNYLDICKELLEKKAGKAGYSLTRWAGYYCGHMGQMTHYAAVFFRR